MSIYPQSADLSKADIESKYSDEEDTHTHMWPSANIYYAIT